MAGIPTYQTQQVDAIPLAPVKQQSIASPDLFAGASDLGQAGRGLSQAGDALNNHVQELQAKADTAAGTQMGADFLNQITDYKIEARKRQGELARGLPEDADTFYNETAKKVIDAAPNDKVKQYLVAFTAQQQPSFRGYIGAHAAEQVDKAEDNGFTAHIASLANASAVDPSTADANAKEVATAIKLQLSKKGITDPDQVQMAVLDQTTKLHTGVINTLMVHNPTAATAYFGTHKDEIAGDQQVKIESALKTAGDANEAILGADKIWSTLGPKADGQPAQLDVMEGEVRKMFAGDAGKIKDTIAEIRSRVSAFNSSETERSAANINKVMDAYAQGKTLSQLKAMPEYNALPGDKKASIQDHVTAQINARQSHADAVLAHQDAAEARTERKRQKAAEGSYFVYSDPTVLSKMTENQVMALLPDLGMEKTNSLIQMKRKLDNPDKVIDAKMDTDDFNQIANSMGLKPFATKASEDEKAALGGLRFRIEHLINDAQDRLKRPLTRVEKGDLMRAETARTVTIDGGWFPDKTVPVIGMAPDQVDKITISTSDRKLAAKRLQTMHDRFPNDPRFQPSEHNLRMIHLQSISPAAEYLNGN